MPDKNYYPDALSKRIAQMFTFTPKSEQTTKTSRSLIAQLKTQPSKGKILKIPEIK
jgi:hypothetical protein